MIEVRELTEEGIEKFRKQINEQSNKKKEDINFEVSFDLEEFKDKKFSKTYKDLEVYENKKLKTKLDVGNYFYQIFGRTMPSKGVWTFLSIVYYRQLLKDDSTVGQVARLIDERKSWGGACHLLRIPYVIKAYYHKEADQEFCEYLLTEKANQIGLLARELFDRESIYRNREFVKLVKRLYENQRNILGKNKRDPGKLRRLNCLFLQYDRTWDLTRMSCDEMYELMIEGKKEFDFCTK